MTHDELISTINKGITMVGQRMATHEEDALLYRKALRAVVGLHKESTEWKDIPAGICLEDGELYPCPTIQKITEELK